MRDDDMQKIVDRIKALRQKNGLSFQQLADKTGMSKSTLQRYESGDIANIPLSRVRVLAAALHTSPAYLMGWAENEKDTVMLDNLFPIETKRFPLLGEIACGEPIFAEEDRESYIVAGTNIKADFALRCKGDSMINARIYDGDYVFIRQQPTVENGEIAAVIIDNEATLKRVMYYPEKNLLVLKPENSKYQDLIYSGEELNQVRILGKAVAFQSDVR